MVDLLEEIRSHNFDAGNYVVEEGVEISFDGFLFGFELPDKVITAETIEEVIGWL